MLVLELDEVGVHRRRAVGVRPGHVDLRDAIRPTTTDANALTSCARSIVDPPVYYDSALILNLGQPN